MQPQHPQNNMGTPSSVFFIAEGVQGYRQIETNGFGSTVTIVMPIGPISDVVGKQFEFTAPMNCYAVENNLNPIDLSEINDHPERFIKLVKVSAPLGGTYLVSEHAIRPINHNNNQGKQLLKG